VYLLELKVSHFGSGHLTVPHVVHLFVELFKDIVRNDRFQPVNNAVFVLLGTLLFDISLQKFDLFVHIESKRHVDQS
jgi:hypothetical protein